jgi:RluA family pseudouridine synthase
VLFEDPHLLALDKPSGLLTSPDPIDPARPSLMQLLHAGIAEQKPWAREHGLQYLANTHRLDPDTSGIVLLARSKPVLASVANRFGSERPCMRYLALARGSPRTDALEINAALGPDPMRPGQTRADSREGKPARTLVRVLESFSGYVLLECEPMTDRPHQIRVHLRHVGLPLVGDSWYGGPPLFLSRLKPGYRLKKGRTERPLIARTALHAADLGLPHPVTGEPLAITAPWPKDLTVAVKYLRRYAGTGAAEPGCNPAAEV